MYRFFIHLHIVPRARTRRLKYKLSRSCLGSAAEKKSEEEKTSITISLFHHLLPHFYWFISQDASSGGDVVICSLLWMVRDDLLRCGNSSHVFSLQSGSIFFRWVLINFYCIMMRVSRQSRAFGLRSSSEWNK